MKKKYRAAAVQMANVGSVFDLTQQQLVFYAETRLGAPVDPDNPSAQHMWGCSSTTGFLGQGESLLACCEKDREVLAANGVTHAELASRLVAVLRAGRERPAELVEGKFKVGFNSFLGNQFCPFTAASDKGANPFSSIDGACGFSNMEFEVTNVQTGRSIKVGGLLPHLIGVHHFFEGSVPHRLDPQAAIDVLELARS